MSIAVLMSTFNGERFIDEQLRSILEQLPNDGALMIRDDGSSDATVLRISSYRDDRIRLICGKNLGFAHSFLTLLAAVPEGIEVVMFSDQDDVWLPGKIDRARRRLGAVSSVPALYCSAQMLVNEGLEPLNATPSWPRGPSFKSALTENIVTGCTSAINRQALQLLQSAGVPSGVRFHDWWFYLVVSAFGTVIVDDQPTLLYRQHGGNLIGHGAGRLRRYLQVLRFLWKHDWVGILLGQVAELRGRFFDRLSDEQHLLLNTHFFFFGQHAIPRWTLVFGLRRWRQTYLQEIPFRILIAMHRLHLWPPGRNRING